MEYSGSYTYAQGDEEKIRLIPFELTDRLVLSHAFFDSLRIRMDRELYKGTFSRLSRYNGEFLIGGRELTELNLELHLHCTHIPTDKACQEDVKEILSHDKRYNIYLLRDVGRAMIAEVYHQVMYEHPIKGRFILVPYKAPYGIALDKSWYEAGEVLGETGGDCRLEEIKKASKIFLEKYFSEKGLKAPEGAKGFTQGSGT